MNRTDYIKELRRRLKYLPAEDREDAISYYEEYLDDLGISENDDVLQQLKSPKEVARDIIDNCTAKAVEEQKADRSIKGSGKVVWMVILGIASLPVSLPVAIVAVALVITILAVVFSILIALVAVAVSIFIAGIVSVGAVFVVPGVATKILTAGMSLVLIGLGVFMMVGIFELFVLVVRAIGNAYARRKSQKDIG